MHRGVKEAHEGERTYSSKGAKGAHVRGIKRGKLKFFSYARMAVDIRGVARGRIAGHAPQSLIE